jgi:hypothetical protein
MDLGMGFEPAILLGFMRVEIVQQRYCQKMFSLFSSACLSSY